jgi:hypothetical protein
MSQPEPASYGPPELLASGWLDAVSGYELLRCFDCSGQTGRGDGGAVLFRVCKLAVQFQQEGEDVLGGLHAVGGADGADEHGGFP